METENTQNPSQQPWQQPPNSSVANLTKAIALQESGQNGTPNYEAVGDNGTSHGAYQWQPGNYSAAAEKYGIDPSDFSPESQDKVAYSEVYSLAKKGYTPDQIAASWNMGPNALNGDAWKSNVGTTDINGQSIKYDTPTYVQAVAKYYNQLSGGQSSGQGATQTQPQQSGMPSWEKWLLGGLGVAGVVGLTAATGGLDAIGGLVGLVGEAAATGAAEGAADAGLGAAAVNTIADTGTAADASLSAIDYATNEPIQGAASSASTPTQPGLLSSLYQEAKNVVGKVAPLAEGAGLYDVAKNFLGGGSNAGGSPGVSGVTPPQFSLTPQSFTQSSNATQNLLKTIQAAVSSTPTGRVFAQSPDAQQGMQANAQYGIIGSDDGQGNWDTSEAQKRGSNMVGELSDGIAASLDAEGTYANVGQLRDEAMANMYQYTPQNEWDDAEKHIDEQLKSYHRSTDKNGDISLGNVERIKKEQGKAAGKWDVQTTSAKRNAHKALYKGARTTVTKNTENKELYETAMKEEKALLNGIKVNKRLNGKKIHKDPSMAKKVVESLAQYASIAIGDKIGGPLGAIVGAVIGHSLERTIEKKFGKNILEKTSTQKALQELMKKKPEVGALIQAQIKKYSNRREAEKEYRVIKKKETPQAIMNEEKEMGTYKLGKNKTTKRVEETGHFRKPGTASFILNKKNNDNKENVRR